MRSLGSLAILLIWIPALSLAAPLAPPDAGRLADRVIDLLVKNEPLAVANLMHFPASYTKEQRQEDMAGVGRTISFLLQRFGSVSQVKPNRERVTFFEVGGGGGDMPYWKSLSPFETFDFIYSAHFAEFGVGVIKVRIFRHPSVAAPEIQAVGFGLLVTRNDAKTKVVSSIKEMMKLEGLPLPPNIDQILEKNLRPEEHEA